MKKIVGLAYDRCKMHVFSAATLIQNDDATTTDTWDDIISDLERALSAAREVYEQLAIAEDTE